MLMRSGKEAVHDGAGMLRRLTEAFVSRRSSSGDYDYVSPGLLKLNCDPLFPKNGSWGSAGGGMGLIFENGSHIIGTSTSEIR